ncbi:hypothetical protein ABH935_006514 [Catenulispora sp. GAS73]|uniref:hypothetical protein n=1 Tax=Catenulispora sp. GAS73 TaxID=3156269 RepID=UPI0035143E82
MAEQHQSGSVTRDAIRLLAGLTDLGLEAAEAALRRTRSILARSDLPELASDLHHEIKAHGDVVLDRVAPPAQAHMEALARRAAAATAATAAREKAPEA